MATEATQLPQIGFAGQAKITAANTTQPLPNLAVSIQVSVKSKSTNNVSGLAVGFSNGITAATDGTNTNATILMPGESATFLVNNANAIFWNTANANDVLTWQGS